ncbi:MAG TPA: hypothetical protein VHY19_16875 [Steroidobacteraceae bacterium]|jgi:hypothetical protein|nr:hypothetical protein [Steroidobacteraceae bacterium]
MQALSGNPASEPADPSPTPATPLRAVPAARAPSGAPQATARMDRQFIAQHQIVERYLSGRLPPKGVLDFEQFCRRHPELLHELGLDKQLQAALRLLEAGGRPTPWEERPRRWWEQPQAFLTAVSVCVLLGFASLIIAGRLSTTSRHLAALKQQLASQPLDPVESTRSILLIPSRSAAGSGGVVTIGAGSAELADLKIDMSWVKYTIYQLTIDRVDQGRVAVLHNMTRDSNGDLRIALNSSALGPGDYRMSIAGLTWSGAPVPLAWVTITIAR